MMKKTICTVLSILLIAAFASLSVCNTEAKAGTCKVLPKGGYFIKFKKAKMKKGYLIVKGDVSNWARAVNTKPYHRKGKFKLKLGKKCEIIDGYKQTTHNITKSKFNKLCKKKDSLHRNFAIMVEKKKVTMVRFW